MISRLLLLCALVGFPVSAAELKVGVAQVDITPPLGAPLAGYYSPRGATGTHDPLHAKAIVLEDGTTVAAMVVCDLISMPKLVTDEVRKLVQKQTGIAASNVMVSATHSHTGPVLASGSSRDPAMGGEMDLAQKYRAQLPLLISAAVAKAKGNLQRITMRHAIGKEETLAFNRRFHMTDGTVGWNPGKLNPKIVRPAGPIDPEVPVVSFEDARNNPIAIYVNYAMHLDTVGGTEYSADYPFALSKILSMAKGSNLLTVFSIGTAGDINHINVATKDPQKGHTEAARIGAILAGEVLKTLPRAKSSSGLPLRTALRVVKLDLPKVSEADVARARAIALRTGGPNEPKFMEKVEAFKLLDVYGRQGKPWEVEVQVLSLGKDVAWVSLPGEIFVEIGLAIKKGSPFANTIPVELANTSIGYIPTKSAYEQGNYEVISARCAPGSEERLIDAALDLLKQLHRN